MNTYYIAGIVQERTADGGGYSVYIPDVPQVAAAGDSVEEAIRNATSGLYVALRGLAEKNNPIPTPSELHNVREQVQIEREQDGLPYPDDTVYQYIPAPELDMTPVRLNVSLPRALVAQIQQVADRQGMTRSGLLAAATSQYLNQYQDKMDATL